MDLSALTDGSRIYLDANVFVYALEGYERFTAILSSLFDRIDRGDLMAVTSELTLAEVLVKPMMNGDARLVAAYEETFERSVNLTVAAVTRDVLVQAARIRAEVRALRLPDAIHVATARIGGCSVFLSNDRRLGAVTQPNVVLLSDHG